jgi:hypothetical protein
MNIKFKTTQKDGRLIDLIVRRCTKEVAHRKNSNYDPKNAEMDIKACHLNGCPLDLEMLLTFPTFEFLHDLDGITNHLDRRTGKLVGFFDPRCSKPVPARKVPV